jgi:hypothetical protein
MSILLTLLLPVLLIGQPAPPSDVGQIARELRMERKGGLAAGGQRGAAFTKGQEQRLGGWRAWIEYTLVGSPMNRALKHGQVVFRQGPRETVPVKLFELTSTGGVRIVLREDGTLLVQGVGTPPALFFPYTPKGITLKLPRPSVWTDKHFGPSPALGETILWLDDLLFYGREVWPARYLIGYLRVDAAKKQIVENRICMEAYHRNEEYAAWAASIATIPPVRIGDYIFWRNRGTLNEFLPENKQGPWKKSLVRVYHLKTHKMVPFNQVPAEIRQANQEKLKDLQTKNV